MSFEIPETDSSTHFLFNFETEIGFVQTYLRISRPKSQKSLCRTNITM